MMLSKLVLQSTDLATNNIIECIVPNLNSLNEWQTQKEKICEKSLWTTIDRLVNNLVNIHNGQEGKDDITKDHALSKSNLMGIFATVDYMA